MASAARRSGFDPASTLGWSVPLLLMLPLIGFVLLISGVRTRRSAVNLAGLTFVLLIADVMLVWWARWGHAEVYRAAFQWINLPVAFSGPAEFQGFGIDVAFRVDHLTLAALLAVAVMMLAALIWQRVGGRAEPGPVRIPTLLLLLCFGACGVIVAGDLAELVAFWMLTGGITYLLLSSRWGSEASVKSARIALSLPFAGDLALLLGIGLLYSRYGSLDVARIVAGFGHTSGAGLKSLTFACVLLLLACFIRAGLFPFSAWMSGTLESPPATVALVQGLWPLLAGLALIRLLPVLNGAGPQAFRFGAYFCALALVAGPLLSWLGNDLRRSVVLAGSAASALGLLAIWQPGATGAGSAALLASSLGRVCLVMCAFAVVAAMRSVDLNDMGEVARRMRLTGLGLALGSFVVALAFGPVPASFGSAGGASLRSVLFGTGVFLLALAVWRGFAVAALAPLRRRRAFEPQRIRDALPGMAGPALGLGGLGLVALVLSLSTGWLRHLAPAGPTAGGIGAVLVWLLVPLLGSGLGVGLYATQRAPLLALHARLGLGVGTLWAVALNLYGRYLWKPLTRIFGAVEEVAIPRGESFLGPNVVHAGGLLGRLPALPTAVAIALVVAVVSLAAGLIGQGVR